MASAAATAPSTARPPVPANMGAGGFSAAYLARFRTDAERRRVIGSVAELASIWTSATRYAPPIVCPRDRPGRRGRKHRS